MLKKSILMLAVIAIIATFVMVPVTSSADILTDVRFEVNFGAESAEDAVQDAAGNYVYDDTDGIPLEDLTFVYDETIGQNVLVMDGYDGGASPLIWNHVTGENMLGYDLTQGLTMEMYVYVGDRPDDAYFGPDGTEPRNYIPVLFEAVDTSLHFGEYNEFDENGDPVAFGGFRCGSNTAGTDGSEWDRDGINAYNETGFPHNEWIHLVGVSDGEHNYFYLNGELAGTTDRKYTALQSQFNGGDPSIYIGASSLGYMWGDTFSYGKVAFANLYMEAATAEQVAQMYAEATGEDAPEVVPSEEPSDEPSDDNNATPAPTKPANVDNTTTFDLGLVSLAAVALSSVVAVKKRR